MIARFSLSEGGGMKFMAQFENLGELVKMAIFDA